MDVDDLTRAIEGLTRRVHAYRTFESFKKGDLNMVLELKGLKGRAMAARAHIGKLDAAYEAFNAKAGNHVSDVEGLTEQLGEMADDLSFATTTLGNSVAASNNGAVEKPMEQSAEKQVITAADIGKLNGESIAVQQTDIQHEPPALPQAGRSGIGGMYR